LRPPQGWAVWGSPTAARRGGGEKKNTMACGGFGAEKAADNEVIALFATAEVIAAVGEMLVRFIGSTRGGGRYDSFSAAGGSSTPSISAPIHRHPSPHATHTHTQIHTRARQGVDASAVTAVSYSSQVVAGVNYRVTCVFALPSRALARRGPPSRAHPFHATFARAIPSPSSSRPAGPPLPPAATPSPPRSRPTSRCRTRGCPSRSRARRGRSKSAPEICNICQFALLYYCCLAAPPRRGDKRKKGWVGAALQTKLVSHFKPSP